MELSKKIKLELYNLLKKEPNIFGDNGDEGIIPFLCDIWDLSSMKSEDSRYQNALGDFVQHLIRNDDYSYDYVFQERLRLLDDNIKFVSFIETILLPKYREGEDDIFKNVLLITPYLEKEGCTLILQDYDNEGYPIYKIGEIPVENIPTDIKQNDLLFYVEKAPSGRSDRISSHLKPKTFPSFVLVHNNWDDFHIRSSYTLFYYSNGNEVPIDIGNVKIIFQDELITNEHIPNSFNILSDDFCSLGQEAEYYFELKKALGNRLNSILFALKDAAFYPDIQDKYERNSNFTNSLIRFDDAERLLREARYRIYDYDLSNLYSFKYQFKPRFSNESVDVDFEFNSNKLVSNRIYALIGKNGTGKTQLITSLPLMISEKKDNVFTPKTPLFSKIIAVSYSIFDRFKIPKKTSTFNYYYCGVRKDENEQFTEKGLALRFHNTWKKIETLERINKWRNILLTFIDEELINSFFIERDENDIMSVNNLYKIDIKSFNEVKDKLSSGQAIILYIITEIVANIRFDSLLLYDEPETHLHPNAITQLMNTIYELVEEFQSFCIIATHSPLVVRELFSKNVYILDREESILSVRRIPLESFGENLSILTEEIFGNKGIPKQHKKILQELVDSGKSYDEIVDLLEFDEFPLSLNARLIIKSMVIKRENSSL